MTEDPRLLRARIVAAIYRDLKALSREIDTLANLVDRDAETPLQERLGEVGKVLARIKRRAKGVGL